MSVSARLNMMPEEPDLDPRDVLCKKHDECEEEKHLWFAVIDRAIRDLNGAPDESNESAQALYAADARMWFASDSNEPGSLQWIIHMTDLDTTAEAIRHGVMRESASNAPS